LFVGEDLVYRRSPEVAVSEVGVGSAVELEDGLDAVVSEEVIAGGGSAGAVGVGMAAGPAVEYVVLVFDGFGDGAAGSFEGDFCQAIAVVPGVVLVSATGNGGFPRAVPFVVVGVVVRAVGSRQGV
jgi:hypothetical protein